MAKPKKKRLAVIGIRGFPCVQGGVESHCAYLIPRIAEDFECVVYRRKPYLSEESNVNLHGIRFVDLPSTRIKGVEALLHTLMCVCHLLFHRVDCVNIHNIGPGMFSPLLRLAGIRVVLTYHSPNYEHDKWGVVAKSVLKLAERVALSMSDKIIFVSPFQRAKYSSRVQEKSLVIPNGVNRQSAERNDGILDRYGILRSQYVLAVGRLTPEKGFESLVKAVQECDVVRQLVIAGASDHDSSVAQRLMELDRKGKLIMTGYTQGADLDSLYRNARLFALSSLTEGFPMVLLEAMSYGLPIVATDIPASHIIELDSRCYVTPADPDSIANGIKKVVKYLPERVEYELGAYDWDAIARQTADVYRDVLKET